MIVAVDSVMYKLQNNTMVGNLVQLPESSPIGGLCYMRFVFTCSLSTFEDNLSSLRRPRFDLAGDSRPEGDELIPLGTKWKANKQ